MKNQGKTDQQRKDSSYFIAIAALAIFGMMFVLTVKDAYYFYFAEPEPITIDSYLDGTEKHALDTMRSIMPNGKGIIQYPDGSCDSIRWFKESSLNISNNDTVSIEAIIKRLVIEEEGVRWYSIDTIWSDIVDLGMLDIIDAIIQVESTGNDNAYCKPEDAVGCLQIRKTMVDDVNRILGRQGVTNDLLYSYSDRWDRGHSVQMLKIYCTHYNLTAAEDIARCWNGGPRGNSKQATLGYWLKVQQELVGNFRNDTALANV